MTINIPKSIFCGKEKVNVLGYEWSNNRIWCVPDHRIMNLKNLICPRTIKEIRVMAGGISSISTHLPWTQPLLVPFYEMLDGRKRLTKKDKEKLVPHWETIKKALMTVQYLYIPPPNTSLTLRVDAAQSGIGAVLLAQLSNIDNDVKPVAFFSKTFDGYHRPQN